MGVPFTSSVGCQRIDHDWKVAASPEALGLVWFVATEVAANNSNGSKMVRIARVASNCRHGVLSTR
jgi:hypothetical protein